jgi:carbon-monoxide dehydrogenase large subunit
MAVTRLFGSSVKRREDPRMITGRGAYTDDIRLPGMAFLAILRSPYAHARIKRIDVSRARSHPGVIAVYTGQDLRDKVGPIPCAWLIPDSDLKVPPYRALATDTVRYTGDAVAAVVASSQYVAHDALDLIDVEYEPLPAVATQDAALAGGAPQLHADAPGTHCASAPRGSMALGISRCCTKRSVR